MSERDVEAVHCFAPHCLGYVAVEIEGRADPAVSEVLSRDLRMDVLDHQLGSVGTSETVRGQPGELRVLDEAIESPCDRGKSKHLSVPPREDKVEVVPARADAQVLDTD